MKKILLSAIVLFTFSTAYSQLCPANDSTQMGSSNDVFYSLKNSVVKTSANNNWHMAISVQRSNYPYNPANGVAIRVNSVLGENPQAGTTGTKLVKLIGANPANWRAIDTTGAYALNELIDSDSTWNLSAFTSGYPSMGGFNFNWGSYNQVSHNVEGNSVFLLYNKSAGWYKKVFIKTLAYDTVWNIIISNVDNTDSFNLSINKSDYPKRLFIYYNVVNNTLIDREPDSDKWDLLWTKYKAMIDFQGGKIPYSVTGVLHNNHITVAQNMGKKCNEVWLANKTAKYANSISTIGHDWKTFTGTAYAITDTFVYFIKSKMGTDSHTYKMTMKYYGGGKTTFNFYEATLNIDADKNENAVRVYPNPANGLMHVISNDNIESLRILDMQGREVMVSESGLINVSGLSNGIYILLLKTENGLVKETFVKE